MTLDALCTSHDQLPSFLIYDTINASSASTTSSASFLFDNAAGCVDVVGAPLAPLPPPPPPVLVDEKVAVAGQQAAGRRKRRRRARSCKNKEDAESQRMTHIAVERNRRRQMNEYLAVLRSLMPESYVQRGDQASIVGGAIDFVKELEQLLQSLEAQKRTLMQQQQYHKVKCEMMQMPTSAATTTVCMESTSNCCSSSSIAEEAAAYEAGPPFAQFFSYPQYIWCHSPRDCAPLPAENRSAVADIEVNLIETHANLRIMSPRRPGQLLKMVAGLESLRLTILHLNVTTLDPLVLYSLSVKVEEGCGLTTVDDIAGAVHHVLCIIEAEMSSQLLLDRGAIDDERSDNPPPTLASSDLRYIFQ